MDGKANMKNEIKLKWKFWNLKNQNEKNIKL